MPSSPPASTRSSPLKALGSSPHQFDLPGEWVSPERFDGAIRRECPDRLLVFHRAQLNTVLSEFTFIGPHNEHRPSPLAWSAGPARPPAEKPLRIGNPEPVRLRRRDKLGGFVHEYRLVASAARTGFSEPTGCSGVNVGSTIRGRPSCAPQYVETNQRFVHSAGHAREKNPSVRRKVARSCPCRCLWM